MRKQWIPGRIFYFERPGYEARSEYETRVNQVEFLVLAGAFATM